MKKKFGKRLLSVAAAVLMAASLLSVSALAADCKHEHMKKGFCDDCDTQYVAVVGKTYYKTLDNAVKAAEQEKTKAVTLLTDLSDQKLKIGKVYFVVDKEAITIENSTITGSGEQVIVNKGQLTLKNTTLNNTKGDYALVTKGGTAVLNKVTMKAEKAQVRMEYGKLELASAPVDGTIFVENDRPGEFAVATGKAADKAEVTWISNSVSLPIFDGTKKSWRMTGSIRNAVTVGEDELVFNGELQLPEVKAKLYGRELVEGEDYEIICPIPDPKAALYESEGKEVPKLPDPVNAGTYTLRVKGLGDYTDSVDVEFTIEKAVPTLKWSAEKDTVTYSGSAAKLNETVKVKTADDSKYEGKIKFTYRTAGSEDEFTDGLPVNAGKYEVMAAVEAFDNHKAAETKTALLLTIEPKKVQPVAKVTADGIRYNGKEHKPAVALTDGDTVIPAKEYKVAYKNNVDVGTAAVTMTAVEGGNYVFAEPVQADFAIAKAAQEALKIEGTPASVVYGSAPVQLSVSGGSTDGAVTWSVTEGSGRVSVDEQGVVTVLGVGKVTVEAVKAGGGNYDAVSAQWSFEVAPAVLTVAELQAADKVFDGTKTVDITKVTLNGVKEGDDVQLKTEGLKGEVADSKAGTYTAVKLTDPKLVGAAAANYKLEVPAEGAKAEIKISKADLTAALESIEVQMTIGSENVAVENLGGAMPKDAGKLVFTNRIQTAGEGTKAVVLNWGVDENGKLTAHVVNGKGGDKITFEVAVASENYNTAVVKVAVSYGANTVEADKLTVTAQSELTYNGKEQKPALTVQYEGVTLTEGTDFDVTYPTDLISAGEKEVKLTFKGSYEGGASAKYTVNKAKLTVSGTKVKDKAFNGTSAAEVTVGVFSGAVEGDDVKVTAKGVFSDKNSGSRTVTVTYAIEGKAAGNYVMDKETESFTAKIVPVTAAQLGGGISGISASNATSANRGQLQAVVEKCNAALADTGLSQAEKTNIENVKYSAQSIIDRIIAADNAAKTESIRATEKITDATVKVEDKAKLQQAKTDLNTALTNYKANYTAGEEAALKEQQTRVDNALTVITRVESAATLINALPDDFDNAGSNLAVSVQDAKESYDQLTDYEKTLIEDPLKNKLTAAGLAAGVESDSEPEATPVVTPQQNVGGTDNGGEDIMELPMWIFWVAVAVASLIALVFIWSKIKKSQEKNW